jgi:hypothetical protein
MSRERGQAAMLDLSDNRTATQHGDPTVSGKD